MGVPTDDVYGNAPGGKSMGIGFGTIANVAGMGLGLAFRKHFQDEAFTNQRRAQELQIKGAKEMADYGYDQQMRMWEQTGYGAQMKQMKEAGLNPAMMYGGAGSGGQLGSGGGAMPTGMNLDSAATSQKAVSGMGIEAAMAAAQIENLKAQTEKTKVDTAKTAGLDTDLGNEDLTAKKFENQIRQMVGGAEYAENVRNANRKLEAEAGKTWNEYEAWKAAGFGTMENNDPNSPIAKAMKAGFEEAEVRLENAKKSGDLQEIQKAVEGFKADLINKGLAPDTPWYYKLLSDVLTKLKMNPLDMIKAM